MNIIGTLKSLTLKIKDRVVLDNSKNITYGCKVLGIDTYYPNDKSLYIGDIYTDGSLIEKECSLVEFFTANDSIKYIQKQKNDEYNKILIKYEVRRIERLDDSHFILFVMPEPEYRNELDFNGKMFYLTINERYDLCKIDEDLTFIKEMEESPFMDEYAYTFSNFNVNRGTDNSLQLIFHRGDSLEPAEYNKNYSEDNTTDFISFRDVFINEDGEMEIHGNENGVALYSKIEKSEDGIIKFVNYFRNDYIDAVYDINKHEIVENNQMIYKR